MSQQVESRRPRWSILIGDVTTYNRYWPVDGLMEANYRAHLVNAAAVQQYEGFEVQFLHTT